MWPWREFIQDPVTGERIEVTSVDTGSKPGEAPWFIALQETPEWRVLSPALQEVLRFLVFRIKDIEDEAWERAMGEDL